MTRLIHRWLASIGIYERARYSSLYYRLLRVLHPEYYRTLRADLRFYRSVLPKHVRLIFDIGANNGDKAWVFAQIAERVVCCEPDPVSVSRLNYRFRRNRKITVEPSAVGSEEGRATMFVAEPGSPYNTLREEWRGATGGSASSGSVSVPMIPLSSLIERHGLPHFIKLDVEGYEWPALRSLRDVIPVLCFEANLPQFYSETVLALEFLSNLSPQALFNLRLRDELLFYNHVDLPTVIEELRQKDSVTYDVFVFTPSQ